MNPNNEESFNEQIDPHESEIIKLKEKVKELEEDLKYVSHNFMIISKQLQISKLNIQEQILNEKMKSFKFVLDLLDLAELIYTSSKLKEIDAIIQKIKEFLSDNEITEHQIQTFDPKIHQIVEKQLTKSDITKIKTIIQKGYSYKDKIIRMSKVKITTNK